ncbi:MAG: slipin family protein [Bacteroidota bacterium]
MKRIRINRGTIGLRFRRGDYLGFLPAGTHWVSYWDEIKRYDLAQPFVAPCELNLLLQDSGLAYELRVVEVADHELVLLYQNGNYTRVLRAGRHAFWNGLVDYEFVRIDLRDYEITQALDEATLDHPDLQALQQRFVVQAYEKGLLLVDGKFERELETGVYRFWKNATQLSLVKADLRQLQLEMSGQELLTKDKAALRINFYTQYRVIDVQRTYLDIHNFDRQLYILLQMALREYVSALSLDDLLDQKDAIGEQVRQSVREKATDLGVELILTGIRDIILPGDVKEIMNQVLIAQKRAQANIITRREETASTRSLLNTAKLMEDNGMLFKLKEMEYVEKIADKINTISLSGGGQVLEQLKGLFGTEK